MGLFSRTVLVCTIVACARFGMCEMDDLESCLPAHWVHSHEEDAQGVSVYRPASYRFPPARGRTGFHLRAGGQLTYFGIARSDGAEPSSGTWTLDGARLRITVNDPRVPPFALEIVSCDQNMLKVRPGD